MSATMPVTRALLSVSDKTGLIDLAKALADMRVELISTGGTAKAIREAGLTVKDVSDVTQFPEMMDGRVKTLHPKIHGGLLALRDNAEHKTAMADHDITGIELLVVNLYPFENTVASGADAADCIENIDIGGPAMIRAAAKNHGFVGVVVDPADYGAIQDELAQNNTVLSQSMRNRLAQKAFARTAAYDAAVSNWMAGNYDVETPDYRAVGGQLSETLRYGENPHQHAALYRTDGRAPGLVNGSLLQGKALSYNNINDGDAAFALVSEFADQGPACVIVKHANPCGVATGASLNEAYGRAFDCDRTSAFGGIVAFNAKLDAETAKAVTEIFTEVVIAPEVSDAAKAVFAAKPNLRLIETGGLLTFADATLQVRPVSGGFLVQSPDVGVVDEQDLELVTKRSPTDQEWADLKFAWRVAKHVKSNAIVYAKDGATVGVGAGQMSRVDSTRIAARKAQDMAEVLKLSAPLTQGAAVASDAFFPFADGVLTAAEAGATALIQPGGAMRDSEVIAAADDAGLAMVFTGMRHFRH